MKDEERGWDRQDISIGTIRSTAKRDTAMRILIHLNENSDALTVTEISEALGMDWSTVKNQLWKLTEAGLTEIIEDKMDARCKYYQIADKKAVEKAIKYYEDRQRKFKEEQEKKVKSIREPERKTKVEVEEVF